MGTLLIAVGAGLAFIVAYHTYGRWLGGKIFRLAADAVCPSQRLRDGHDYVPTPKAVVFGHHFTSIAGTGPIVGPAIAVMWGWLPALLWVVLGSIFIGAVHDLGALVVSLRNNGQTVGDIAGRVLNRRVRLLFLFVLFMALTIVLAIFGLVIAAVFRQYPAAIFPCMVQIPLAIAIGVWLYRRGKGLLLPSLIALAVMYLTVVVGDENFRTSWTWLAWVMHVLHAVNAWMASWPTIVWVLVLLVYSYIASVLPVWVLLQPRDYINSLQLISALGLIVIGLVVAAALGGAPPVEGAERQPLAIAAPMVNWKPAGAPLIFPFLFITIACGAISGFHCLVSSGTSSKQLKREPDARLVGYGSMLTEGFLATLVILACVAGLGLGITSGFGGSTRWTTASGQKRTWNTGEGGRGFGGVWAGEYKGRTLFRHGSTIDVIEGGIMVSDRGEGEVPRPAPGARVVATYEMTDGEPFMLPGHQLWISADRTTVAFAGEQVWPQRYRSWSAAGGLARTVGSFVDGSANFLKALGIPAAIAVALMGVLVASFAGTTLDTACRLQRYVIQELAATFAPSVSPTACAACGYELSFNVSGTCPECGAPVPDGLFKQRMAGGQRLGVTANPITWLTNKHAATIFAVVLATAMAALPAPGQTWSWSAAGSGGMILWPMFGATNQLLGGLAFLVIAFYLWRRKVPIWFLVLPMVFMLIMPAWAMIWQLFVADADKPGWLFAPTKNWTLIFIALATLALETWMLVEAALLWPRVRGVLEPAPPSPQPAAAAAGEAVAG